MKKLFLAAQSWETMNQVQKKRFVVICRRSDSYSRCFGEIFPKTGVFFPQPSSFVIFFQHFASTCFQEERCLVI